MKAPSIKITELTAGAVGELEDIGELFARAFEDQPTYLSKRPRTSYLKGLLEQESFIAIAAKHEGNVVGGAPGLVSFTQYADLLLGRVSFAFHGLGPFWTPRLILSMAQFS